jgi:hypothetical protein
MLLALRNYQQVQAWHLHDNCGCSGPVQVDPNWRPNPEINTVLPASGPGFATYNREENGKDQVGLASFINYIQALGVEWEKQNEVPFQVGDISREGGGPFPPHSAHQNGIECDLRPFRKDGAMEPTNINDPSYDREQTRDFCKLVKQRDPKATILFNDSVLIKEGLCKFHKGHHNHLHLKMGSDTPAQEVEC